MAKTQNLLVGSFASLGIVLLVLAFLAVPSQQARADDPQCGLINHVEVVCSNGLVCVDGLCVAPVDCSAIACQAGTGGPCNANCLGKVCSGGSGPTAVCGNHPSFGYCYCP